MALKEQRDTTHFLLETRDLKKSAASITLIRQHLWVSDALPGADQYDDFHRCLAETLGLEAERLANNPGDSFRSICLNIGLKYLFMGNIFFPAGVQEIEPDGVDPFENFVFGPISHNLFGLDNIFFQIRRIL